MRQGPGRDRRPRPLGLARSLQQEPPRARRCLRDLCRQLAQPLPHRQGRHRIAKGATAITRFKDEAGDVRGFCANCGTPVSYERKRSPQMVNLPRALFDSGTGREPLYHIALEDSPEWAWRGEALKPLKGFPGVLWTGPKRRRRSGLEALFEP